MSVLFKDLPPELTAKLEWWYRRTSNAGTRPLRASELESYYNSRPRRGVGSDVQFELTIPCLKRPRWIPPTPDSSSGIGHICGKWMRDLPYHRNDKVHKFESIERTEALLPFQKQKHHTGHAVSLQTMEPLTDTCTITELPTEITQQILSYILPTGCAFQFFLGRFESEKVHCVQKFVPGSPEGDSPTSSTNLAVARTCRRLRDEAHALFYGKNAFVFHLTPCAMRPETRVVAWDLLMGITAWTRVLPSQAQPAGLGPFTSLAVTYLRNVALVASLPLKHTSTDVETLTASMLGASTILQRSENLRCLAIDLPEPREAISVCGEVVSVVEALQIQFDNGQLNLVNLPLTNRERAQHQILTPFDDKLSTLKVDELKLSKWISGKSRQRVRAVFENRKQQSVPGQANDQGDERETKRQRL